MLQILSLSSLCDETVQQKKKFWGPFLFLFSEHVCFSTLKRQSLEETCFQHCSSFYMQPCHRRPFNVTVHVVNLTANTPVKSIRNLALTPSTVGTYTPAEKGTDISTQKN